jgi:hypothetical protein
MKSSRALFKSLFANIIALAISAQMIGTLSAQTNPTSTGSTANTVVGSSKGITWSQLSGNQQKILSPLEADWDLLSSDRKQKWVQVATRFEKLPAAEQERLQSRMKEWAKLSSNERRIARDHYLQSLNISSEKKAEAWQAYQQLSPEEKKKLADEAVSKKPSLVNSPSLKSK